MSLIAYCTAALTSLSHSVSYITSLVRNGVLQSLIENYMKKLISEKMPLSEAADCYAVFTETQTNG